MQVCIWGVVCKKHSGSVSEILGENLECVHEMAGKCSKNMWEVSKIFASFQEVSRMFPGSFWEVSGESLVSVRKSTGGILILINVLLQL